MKRTVLVGAVAWLCFVSAANGDALPRIRDLPLQAVYEANDVMVIESQQGPTRHELVLPCFPVRHDGVLCLRFEAYLKMPQPGGWNPYLGVVVNGHRLDQYTRVGHLRLLKRDAFFQTTLGPKPWWGKRDGQPLLNAFFGPGGEVMDQRVTSQREDGCWYLLDISDVAHFLQRGADDRVESEEANTVAFVNAFTRKLTPKLKNAPPLVIDHLTAGYLPAAVAQKLRRSQMETYQPIRSGPTIDGPAFQLRVGPGGGMDLTVAGDRYFFTSAFSFSKTPEMGFHRFTPKREKGTDPICRNGPEGASHKLDQSPFPRDWNPTVRLAGSDVIIVAAEADAYRLERRIVRDGPRIRVFDQIQNRLDEPIGLVIRNSLVLDRIPGPGDWRLAGTDRESVIGGAAANPTLFAVQQHGGVGIVAEDNVFRLQLELLRRYNAFDFQTTHFGLDAGKSYTLQWTIYPTTDRDYFGLVNRVRRDWGVNYTIEGPFVFDDQVVPGRAARLYALGPWLDYHHDGSQTRENYAARVRPMCERLRKAQPDAILMPKLESNLFTMNKTRIERGDVLPGSDRQTGRYGFTLGLEQSQVLEKTLGPWSDSVLRTEDGRIIIDTYYPGYLPNKKELFNLLLYVRDGNYRHRFFLDQIDFAMDQLGFDGVYIDQFSQEGSFSRLDRFTYDWWDGHTVDLDADGRIRRQRTDCNLVGATGRAKVLKHVLEKGGRVVTNGQSTVRETRGLPVYAFQEMDNDRVNPLEFLDGKPPSFYWQARGHLGCPLILGLRPVRFGEAGKEHWAEVITKGIITALRNGVLYYYYVPTIPAEGPGAGAYGPLNHMFPFTPVNLHEGWLEGQERIITCVSRPFDWPHTAAPTCLLFDLHGRRQSRPFPITRSAHGWQVNVTLKDWNEIAILEQFTPE